MQLRCKWAQIYLNYAAKFQTQYSLNLFRYILAGNLIASRPWWLPQFPTPPLRPSPLKFLKSSSPHEAYSLLNSCESEFLRVSGKQFFLRIVELILSFKNIKHKISPLPIFFSVPLWSPASPLNPSFGFPSRPPSILV